MYIYFNRDMLNFTRIIKNINYLKEHIVTFKIDTV